MTTADAPRALLIGATGPTGREILATAATRNVALRAMARDPDALSAGIDARHEVVRGDVTRRESLVEAIRGIDTVISVLGTKLTLKPVTLLSQGTRHVVNAMRDAGASRLICVTGMGAGDSRGHGGFLYDRFVLPLLLRTIYADKDRQEAVVRGSGLDWLIVRPAMLTNGAAAGRYRVLTNLTGQRMAQISRKDVAAFIVGETRDRAFGNQVVNLSD